MKTQSQKITYSAVCEETGKEIIGFELRRGIMKEDQMKKDESILIPSLINMIQNANS